LQKTAPTEDYQYDQEKRKVAKQYEDQKLGLSTVNDTLIPVAFCLALFLTGASTQLARSLGSASGSYWISLWGYLVVFVISLQLVTVPLGFYSGYILDHHYDLSTQNIRGWAIDEVKGLGVELVLAILAGTVLYYLVSSIRLWWIAAAGVFAVFSIIISVILPFVILPIFYKVTPLFDVKLKDDLLEMANRTGVGNIERVLLVDESRKSIRANAFFSGVGKSKSIVLFDTLLNNFTHREIITVVAHELGHYVHKDVWTEAVTSGLLIIPPLYIADIALRLAVHTGTLASLIDPAGIPLILAILIGVNFVLQPVSNAISRSVERRADEFALKVANDPEAQASTERRLADLALADDKPNRLIEILFYTHPPASKRIKLAEEWMKTTSTDR
jgi:STE24 endopeptidase